MSEVVASFGTGFLHTTIVRCGEGDYRWTRRPGPRRDGVVHTPGAGVLAAVGTASYGRVRLTLPESRDGAAVTYRTDQARSLAGMFLPTRSGGGDAHGTAHGKAHGTGHVETHLETDVEAVAAETFAETGAALARLHAVPLPGEDLPSPDGPRRLLDWLRTGRGPAAAPDLHRRAVEILGRDRMAAVAAWCAPPAGEGRALLHGAPSQGVILPPTTDRDGSLLTGEDVSAGPPESDVGWLVGELVEFRELARRFGHGALREIRYDDLIGCVLRGYAAPLDLAAVGRVATLRFLTHIHDFAAYMRWHDVLLEYLKLVADVVDAAGAGRLLSPPGEALA